MFNPSKPFYMTRAVAEELSQEHQQFILQYIFQHYKQLSDYLQIFDFYIENNEQWLILRQEEPKRETTIFVKLTKEVPIHRKLWVMDQDEHIMILFPEDY